MLASLALVVTSYCPGDSALNPVERLWSPCTQALKSVYLPAVLEGETRPPCAQAGLSLDEKIAKEHNVFNAAMDSIQQRYWAYTTFSGRPICTVVKKSGEPEQPYPSTEYRAIHKTISSSATHLKANKPTYDEYKFACKHLDRRIGMSIFSKCVSPTDCLHCTANPAKAAEMLDAVKNFPSPKPSTHFPGHFMSLIEALALHVNFRASVYLGSMRKASVDAKSCVVNMFTPAKSTRQTTDSNSIQRGQPIERFCL